MKAQRVPNSALVDDKSRIRSQWTLQDISTTPSIIARDVYKADWSARFHEANTFVKLFSLSSEFSDLARVFSELVALTEVYANR